MDLVRESWIGMVRQAKAGNVDAARDVLREFVDIIEAVRTLKDPEQAWTGPIPWQLADYLAIAFREALEPGADPAHALNLVGKTRGRRKAKTVQHDAEILAAAFWLLLRNGLKPQQANDAIQKEFGADRSTVWRARRQFGAFSNARRIEDERLKVITKPHASKIARILADDKKRRKK